MCNFLVLGIFRPAPVALPLISSSIIVVSLALTSALVLSFVENFSATLSKLDLAASPK